MEGSRIADIVFGTGFHVVFFLVLRVRCLYLAPSLRRWDKEACLEPRALSLHFFGPGCILLL